MTRTKYDWLRRCTLGLAAALGATASFACPDGYSRNMFGMCMPNIGHGGAIDPGRVAREAFVEQNAPILKNYILVSRGEAFGRVTFPLPARILQQFSGFYAPNVLSVRWGVGGGNDLSLQSSAFRYGDRQAIVLDTVIVFRDMSDASESNLGLWAHELAHVEQYRAWGIDDFTKRYLRDHNAVEAEAERRAQQFLAWRASQPLAPPQAQRWPAPPIQGHGGSVCVTQFGSCGWFGPIGGGCSCAIRGGLYPGVIR